MVLPTAMRYQYQCCIFSATGCYNSTRTRTDRVYGATRYYAMSGTDVAVCDQMIGPEPIWNTKFVIPVHGEIKDIQPPLEYILYQERGCLHLISQLSAWAHTTPISYAYVY